MKRVRSYCSEIDFPHKDVVKPDGVALNKQPVAPDTHPMTWAKR